MSVEHTNFRVCELATSHPAARCRCIFVGGVVIAIVVRDKASILIIDGASPHLTIYTCILEPTNARTVCTVAALTLAGIWNAQPVFASPVIACTSARGPLEAAVPT